MKSFFKLFLLCGLFYFMVTQEALFLIVTNVWLRVGIFSFIIGLLLIALFFTIKKKKQFREKKKTKEDEEHLFL